MVRFDAEEEEPESKKKDGPASLHFFLDMSRLGKVHLQASMTGNVFQGLFDVENEKVGRHLQDGFPALQAMLGRMGFSQAACNWQIASRSLLQEFKETLQETVHITEVALLDITI